MGRLLLRCFHKSLWCKKLGRTLRRNLGWRALSALSFFAGRSATSYIKWKMSIFKAVGIGILPSWNKASSDFTHQGKKWQFSCSSPAFLQLASEWGCLRPLNWKRFHPQRDSWNVEYSSQWYTFLSAAPRIEAVSKISHLPGSTYGKYESSGGPFSLPSSSSISPFPSPCSRISTWSESFLRGGEQKKQNR